MVIPCFCNEQSIAPMASELVENEREFSSEVSFEYIMVDDASYDGTLSQLVDFKSRFPERVKVVKLKNNVGSYNAIYAGVLQAEGDCIVIMSADQQDPPRLIVDMYKSWQKGNEVVLAVRSGESDFKEKMTLGHLFRWLLKVKALPSLPVTGFDYCLFDSEIARRMTSEMPTNVNSLYRLLSMGARVSHISYTKRQRIHGRSMWTLQKKVKLAFATLHYFYLGQNPNPAYFWKKREALDSAIRPFIIEKIY